MVSEPVVVTVKVKITDADDQPILVGSVLRRMDEENCIGVVTRVIKDGERGVLFEAVGDVQIQLSPGCTRSTSQYKKWRHVPREEQTYQQRYLSWRLTPWTEECFDDDLQISRDEQQAVNGIMEVLPDDIVNWDYGPFPDTFQDALGFMTKHLTALQEQIDNKEEDDV